MKTLCGTILAAAMAAQGAEWISVPDAPVYRGAVKDGSRAADGTSWLSRAKGTALKKFAPKDIASDWAWYDVGEYDFSALQKIPRPTMNGLCLVVKGDVEFDRMELTCVTE